MNAPRRWTALAAVMALPIVLSCGDGTVAPAVAEPGSLVVTLETKGGAAPVGGLVVLLYGNDVADPIAYDSENTLWVYRNANSGAWQIAIIGKQISGRLFSFKVPDVTKAGAYRVELQQVADQANMLQASGQYGVSVGRLP